MLKLHQLDISGFKSFVDPVNMNFAGGITAIVGPNGCGKSNISDAITWVLGEQSAKSLRGTSMQDVIFNGTDTRKPIGMAEVSLTLSTPTDFDYAVDGKITLGRRVFRTGESEYRLNGKTTRLKKIKDLLMDTGLGIRAYSVIEQGKIGMILSGKPQERRRLLEEAAGITRYKARKRLAEIKLEEATANLLRLDDIISEVERALRSLKRQANAALRYKAKESEYRELLLQVLLGRWSLLRDRMGELNVELDGFVEQDAELTAILSQDEAALAEGREDLDELARDLAERHQHQADLAATIEGRQEFLKGSRQRLVEIRERLEQGSRDAEDRRRQAMELNASLGNLDERTTQLIAERDEAARVVADDDERIEAAQQNVEQTETRLEGLRQEMLTMLGELNQLRSQAQQEQVEIDRRTYRQRYLNEVDERLAKQLSEAESTLQTIDEKVAGLQTELDATLLSREDLTKTLDGLLRREAEITEDRRQMEARLAGLGERQRILISLSEEHAERRRLLVDKLAALGVAEPRFLAHMVQPVEGWEDAVDHFLGDLLDAILIEKSVDGIDLARTLAQHGTSGVFVTPQPEGSGTPVDLVDDPAIRYALSDALQLPAEVGRALPPAYLVDSAGDAARLAAAHPGAAFLSRDRMWSMAGTVHAQGEDSAPGVLALESELETIQEEIPALEHRLVDAAERLEGLVSERTRTAAEANRLNDRATEMRREIAVAQARRQDASGRFERFKSERRTVLEEQSEISADLEVRAARKTELVERLRDAETAHRDATESFDRTQLEVDAARSDREALRTVGAGRKGRLEVLEERMESQHQEVLRMRQRIEEGERLTASWNDEKEGLERRTYEIEAAMGSAEEELQGALEKRAAAQEAVLEQQAVLDERRDGMRSIENRVQQARLRHETLRSRIEEMRVGQATLRQDAEHLGATFVDEFKQPLPGLHPESAVPASEDAEEITAAETEESGVAEASEATGAEAEGTEGEGAEAGVEGEKVAAEPEPEPIDLTIPNLSSAELAELEGDLARCKAILERLGPVNVLAAEEYEEQNERETFLKAQRRDVADSVANLKETIREINETSAERFKETFEDVNRSFGETFTKVFRGGEAEMRLLDDDDVLESGIEIVARPPGKRPQNIMLLSGGEKALTAIALLFALFQSRPSPFCILDEVDAPLDDVNVLRFVELLKEMAQDTQFLVVTHNKLTMEVASSLYGVTMEERGISKLVSVEMDDIHPESLLQDNKAQGDKDGQAQSEAGEAA